MIKLPFEFDDLNDNLGGYNGAEYEINGVVRRIVNL